MPTSGKLVGAAKTIFAGSPHGLVEGPHLFKRNGWYYLTTAEGGTGYDHAVTMARSRKIDGPYELHPNVHLMTSKDAPDAVLQRAGHGQIVETPDGQVYHTHLCSRPLTGLRRSPLGRETAIQKCVWGEDDWLCLAQGGQVPAVDVPAPFAARASRSPVARDYAFSPSRPAARLPVAADAASGADLLAFRPPGLAAPDRARIDRLLVRAGAGRAPAGAFRLSRRDGAGFRARGHFSRRRGCSLLQPLQIPFPGGHLGRDARARADDHELRRRLSRGAAELPARTPIPLGGDGPVRLAVVGRPRKAAVRLRARTAGATSGRSSTPRSSPTKQAAASTAPSPALLSGCSHSTPRAGRSR